VSSSGVEPVAGRGETTNKAKDDYKAFYAQTQAQFDLWIRPNEANPSPAVSIPYSRRMNMTHDDGGWFIIIMQFDSGPILSVRLHGRDMEELFMKLLGHEVIYVREFDPRKWCQRVRLASRGLTFVTGNPTTKIRCRGRGESAEAV
jgi:hypothetical protein